jgi:alpha-tubulin suppressor-like RCC1 family protein
VAGRLAIVGLLAVGCGRIGFDASGAGGDAGTDGPVAPATGWAAAAIADNGTHACALRVDGSLWCWGTNQSGQLGDGTTDSHASPVRVGTDTDWAIVAAAQATTCATKRDGSLRCWGANYAILPTRIGTDSWMRLDTGTGHVCGVKQDGSLWCWGNNNNGELGDGTLIDSSAPVQVGVDTDWADVTAGGARTCALKTDASLWCWGANAVGDGTPTDRPAPTRIGTDQWAAVSAGGAHTCGRKVDGSIWCWGYGYFGQVGDTTLPADYNQLTPAPVGTDTSWMALSMGGLHSCALKADGSAWCWGIDLWGELVDGNVMLGSNVPTATGAGSTFTSITAGAAGTCAVQAPDGTLVCAAQAVTLGDGSYGLRATPRQVGTQTGWSEISAGYNHGCARNGTALWCWGDATIGDGTPVLMERPRFVQVGAATAWQSMAAGSAHTCAIATDGSLSCWGTALNGASVPTKVGVDTDWAEVCSGADYSCAVKTGNTLWCWGSNTSGRLGDGTTTDRAAPTQIGALAALWAHVSCGEQHACAVRTDGTLWCWGANADGELGDGTRTEQHAPEQIQVGLTYTAVAAGAGRTSAIRSDNSLWVWGLSGIQVTDPSNPAQLGAALDWTAVASGAFVQCGIRAGTLWCWGDNVEGEIGDGTTITRNNLTQVGSDTDWAEIRTGSKHTCARKLDGSIWCWGWNENGQLGDAHAWRPTFAPVL